MENVFGYVEMRKKKDDKAMTFFRSWDIKALILSVLIVLCSPASASVISISSQQHVEVVDGDTIKISRLGGSWVRVRLSGIDAPELNQEYGLESANYLRNLLKDRGFIIQSQGRDRYKRILGIIQLNTVDVNLEMIKGGYAWAYRRYLNDLPDKKGSQYLTAELNARHFKLGIWSQEKPISPWQFRRGQK